MRRMVAGWMLWIGLSVTTSVVSQDAGLPSTDVIYDQWSPLVTLQNSTLDPLRTWYVSPVHATVLPDGGVLIFGFVQTAVNPPHQQYGCAATILRPENIKPTGPMAVEVSPLTIPLEFTNWTPFAGGSAVDNIYCCGHTLLHDGSFFSAGATRGFSIGADFYTLGVPYATRLNPTTGAWTRIAETMKGLDPRAGTPPGYRWYPTCGRLWNKTILVAAGLAIVAKNNDLASGTPNLSVEIFNPVSGTWTVHSNFQNDPFGTTYPSGTPHEIWKGDYPHFWQLPVPALGFLDVLFFGEYGYPVGMSLNSSAGSMSGSPSPPPGWFLEMCALERLWTAAATVSLCTVRTVAPPVPFSRSGFPAPLRTARTIGAITTGRSYSLAVITRVAPTQDTRGKWTSTIP